MVALTTQTIMRSSSAVNVRRRPSFGIVSIGDEFGSIASASLLNWIDDVNG